MKRFTLVLVLVACLSLLALPVLGAELSGELSSSVLYELDGGFSQVPVGFKLNVDDNLGGMGRMHLSLQGLTEPIKQEAQIKLHEAYMAAYLGDVDLTIGRQVISWGTTDGFNPTNYFGRMGSDALLQGELAGEPVTGAQATYYGRDWFLTGVVTPIFAPQSLADLKSMLGDDLDNDPETQLLLATIDNVDLPDKSLKNMEYGLKAETMLGGWDVQLSAYYGFEPLPGLEAVTELDPVTFEPTTNFAGEYRRQWFAGLATAGILGDIGVRAELTYGGPTEFQPSDSPLEIRTPLSVNDKYLQAVVGADYTFPLGNGLYVQGQYIYQGNGNLLSPYYIPSEDPDSEGLEAGQYAFAQLMYDINPDTTVDLIALHNLEDNSGILLPGLSYRFANGIELGGGLIKTYGDGEFSMLPDQVSLSVKYQF